MTKKTKSYWEKRQQQWINNLNKDDEKFTKSLEKYYNKTSQEIEKDIASYFQRYGKDDVIEYRTLMKDLPAKDKKLLIENMELFAEKYPEYEHLIPVRESVYKLNRLEGLHYSTQMNLLELGAIEQQEFEKYLSKVYGEQYKIMFDELGLGKQFLSINESIIHDVIYTKWINDRNFSDSIWNNKNKLLNHLTTNYRDQIVRGDNYDKMSKMIVDRFGVAYNDAKRLVWTESSFVLNQAHAKPYIDVGLVEYELNAILDGRTSVICREFDKRAKAGESFRFDEMVVGINFPPFHAYCRTTFIGKNLDSLLEGDVVEQESQADEFEFSDNVSSELSDEHKQHYEDIMNNAPEQERELWEKYQGDLVWANNLEDQRDTAHFAPSRGVTLNTTQDLEGSWFSEPGTVFFHEFGHNIDYLTGDHDHYQGMYIHKKFATAKVELSNGKTLGDTVISEVRKMVNTKKGSAAEKRQLLKQEMLEEYELDIPAMASISDLYGGATDNKMILGAGHEKDYWKKPKGSFYRSVDGKDYRSEKVGNEAFAEMYSATVRNSGEVEKFKKWLPESYEMYQELVSKMLGG